MTGEFAVAVHALVFLNHKGCTLSSEALAENVCTNPARIRKVMAQLKKAGLVHTREGAEGGYAAALPPEQISLARVLDALGEPAVSARWRSGDINKACQIASGMGAVLDGVYEKLNLACEKELSKITVKSIDEQIFG